MATRSAELEVTVAFWYPGGDESWFFWTEQPPELLLSRGDTELEKEDVWPAVDEDDHDFRAV